MSTTLDDFGAFLDSIRKSRNLTREDFVEGIMSLRQYQRFVNGESSLTNEKLFRLIDKTGMNFLNVHKLYTLRTTEQRTLLNNIYKEIMVENYSLATELISKLSINDFRDEYNRSFYELCKLILSRRTKTMPSNLVMDKLKQLINYPESMKNDIVSFVEYNAYLEISNHSKDHEDKTKIINFLYKKINTNNIASNSLYVLYLPSTYSLITQQLGVLGEYEKSIIIAQKGIDFCLKFDSLNSLAHLLMYKALGLKYLDKYEESLLFARRTFALLSVENKKYKTNNFTKVFEENFNMKVSDL